MPLSHYGLHQRADGSLEVRLPTGAMCLAASAREALHKLLGGWPMIILPIEAEDKSVQYSSDFEGAQA